MQRRLALWVSVVSVSAAAALSSACGSSTSLASQLAPSGPVSLTSLAITVNPPSIGATTQATATATFSNGSTSAVASGFTSDTPGVATVTTAGVVSGVAIGDVTISVDYQGMRASKKVRVLPGYAGTFSGTYVINTCVETGGFVNTDPTQDFCAAFTTGRVLQTAVQNTQSTDLTTLTGLFLLGGLQGSGSGTVSSDGTLTYTGAVILGTTRMDFRNWTATSPAPGHVTGSFDMVWTDSATEGSGILTCSNLDMTRQAAAASTALSARSPSPNSDWRSLIMRLVPHR